MDVPPLYELRNIAEQINDIEARGATICRGPVYLGSVIVNRGGNVRLALWTGEIRPFATLINPATGMKLPYGCLLRDGLWVTTYGVRNHDNPYNVTITYIEDYMTDSQPYTYKLLAGQRKSPESVSSAARLGKPTHLGRIIINTGGAVAVGLYDGASPVPFAIITNPASGEVIDYELFVSHGLRISVVGLHNENNPYSITVVFRDVLCLPQ